jgi:hypothetical protein
MKVNYRKDKKSPLQARHLFRFQKQMSAVQNLEWSCLA